MGCALTARPDRVASAYRSLSLWHETAADDWVPRTPLLGSTDVDVAIVGAGFTGLWTAYHLAGADPTLRIAVLEREVAGFGASGRNGGWCSALFPASARRVMRSAVRSGADPAAARDGARRQLQALQDSVRTVGDVLDAEGIDAHHQRGGMVRLARTEVQLRRLRAEVAAARDWGQRADDLSLLDAVAARARCDATNVIGATFTPHCAAVHPARLVRGLARAVERRGVRLYEQTPARQLASGSVHTRAGTVQAEVVVRATEGYTRSLVGSRRQLAPIYSLIVATEPLPAEVWATIGLSDRETLSDGRHLIIYAQRTADDRLVFGGRGAPYHFGSGIRPAYDREPTVFRHLEAIVRSMFPALRDAAFTHRWGGPLGIPRDWHASVGFDRDTGLAWAGGYVGDGVGASQLAGQTLADLITGRDSDLVDLPWVGHRSRRWEPEPLRWLEINTGLRLMALADAEERLTRRSSVLARAMSPFLGGR